MSGTSEQTGRGGRRRGRTIVAVIAAIVLVVGLVVIVSTLAGRAGGDDHGDGDRDSGENGGDGAGDGEADAGTPDPLAAQTLYVDPDSSAARAAAAASATAAERDAAAVLAAQPTAIWLTPERDPVGTVGRAVTGIIAAAASEHALPVLAVYGITDRDCGGQSAGGLPPTEYLTWIGEIARAIGAATSVVVLEPDALALAPECPDPAARVALVGEALTRFAGTAAIVYLDGGHSAWLPADRMAALLADAGVANARGFATNVSNTQSTGRERAYAADVERILRRTHGVDDVHAVIDVSRNGNGPPSDGEWCNPPGRAIGDDPHALDDPVVDGVLWVKPPGESDGQCNGGPPAGEWWAEQAVELVRNAR